MNMNVVPAGKAGRVLPIFSGSMSMVGATDQHKGVPEQERWLSPQPTQTQARSLRTHRPPSHPGQEAPGPGSLTLKTRCLAELAPSTCAPGAEQGPPAAHALSHLAPHLAADIRAAAPLCHWDPGRAATSPHLGMTGLGWRMGTPPLDSEILLSLRNKHPKV